MHVLGTLVLIEAAFFVMLLISAALSTARFARHRTVNCFIWYINTGANMLQWLVITSALGVAPVAIFLWEFATLMLFCEGKLACHTCGFCATAGTKCGTNFDPPRDVQHFEDAV